jgi:hypothetical protein
MPTAGLLPVAGVFGITLLVGWVVLMTAESSVTAVARAAARDISGSFWVGLLWQLLAAPLLLVLVVASAITIIGILAIPVVVLAWALAYAGAFTLGVLAVAIVAGRAIAGKGKGENPRAVALRSLTVGLLALSLLWFGAALIAGIPVAGLLARLVAVAFSWAGATVGLGAVVKSRGGVVRLRFDTTTETSIPSWQTPTPVQGVVAARRPVVSTPPSSPVTPDK